MVLQYVAVKPLMNISAGVTHAFGLLCPGSLKPQQANLWINLINSISVLVAMRELLSIYYVVCDQIRPYSPSIQGKL